MTEKPQVVAAAWTGTRRAGTLTTQPPPLYVADVSFTKLARFMDEKGLVTTRSEELPRVAPLLIFLYNLVLLWEG